MEAKRAGNRRISADALNPGITGFANRRSFIVAGVAFATLATPALALSQPDKAVAAYYPPLMMDQPEQPGLSIEILQHAAARIGRRVEITFLPFARALKTLRRREDFLMPAFFRNPEREPHYTWVAKTHVERRVFNTLGPRIDTLDAARKLRRIGVETDAAMDVMLTKHGFENLERNTSPVITTQQLRSGRIDAWALTHSVSRWIWKDLKYPETLVQGSAVGLSEVYLAASKTVSAGMVAEYASAIQDLHDDGVIGDVLARYGA